MTNRQMLLYSLTGLIFGILLGIGIEFSSQNFRTTIKQYLNPQNESPKEEVVIKRIRNKKDSAKEQQLNDDIEQMDLLGLYYDYHKLSLEEVVEAYMEEYDISEESISFSYQPISYDEPVEYRANEAISIGLIDALPVNMYVSETVKEDYEELQYYSLGYQDVSSTLYLATLVGGLEEVYNILDRYGVSNQGDLPTMDLERDQTTTDYLVQLTSYLWEHQEIFSNIFDTLIESYIGRYFDLYLPTERVLQYPSDDGSGEMQLLAIVYEETPYVISLATKGLSEYEVGQLGYVINEWHRVNMN